MARRGEKEVICLLSVQEEGEEKRLDEILQHGLSPDLSWERVRDMAVREGVSGLIAHHIKRLHLEGHLPSRIHADFTRAYTSILMRNQLLVEELCRISRILREKGVPLLPIQGIALLSQVYPSLGMRPLSDIDLLVRPGDRGVVQEVLGGLGYRGVSIYPWVLVKEGILLDLHTDIREIVQPSRIVSGDAASPEVTEAIWRESVAGENDLTHDLAPSRRDHLILCAAHFQKHSFSRLIWAVDLARLIQDSSPPLNWDEVTKRARLLHLEKPLYFSLTYLSRVFPLPSLSEAITTLSPPRLFYLEKRILRRIEEDRPVEGMGEILYVCTLKTWRERCLFLFRTLFPPRAMMRAIGEGYGRRALRLLSRALCWFRNLCNVTSFFRRRKFRP